VRLFGDISATDIHPWSDLHGDCSTATPTALSLRPLVPSCSLVRCETIQVYYHQLRSRVPLDHVHHIVDSGDYLVLELGRCAFRSGLTIELHIFALMVTRAVGQFIIPSFHPDTGYLQVLVGIVMDVVQVFHTKLLVAPCLEAPRRGGRWVVGALCRILNLLGSSL
jgi:hypothetical protein